jgi:hypothetical protein
MKGVPGLMGSTSAASLCWTGSGAYCGLVSGGSEHEAAGKARRVASGGPERLPRGNTS